MSAMRMLRHKAGSVHPITASYCQMAVLRRNRCPTPFPPAQRALAVSRSTVIGAYPDLRERELLKRAQLVTAIEDALRSHAIDDLTARLAATIGMLAFEIGYDRWAAAANEETFSDHVTKEAPFSHSLDQHTIAAGAPLLIDDARTHPLGRDNPAVRALDVVAYAGLPLVTASGDVLGSVCVIDHAPRVWTAEEVAVLSDLASSVLSEIELHTRLTTRVHAALEVERDQLREILAQAPTLIALLVGPEHVFEFVNPPYQHSTGRTEAALLGKTVQAVFPELQEQGFIGLLDDVYRTGVPSHATETLVRFDRRGDGGLEDGYISFTYQPLRDAAGIVQGILVNGVAVTDQVQARRRLQELAAAAETERARLQQVMDVLPEGIVITDGGGRVLRANRVAAHLLGPGVIGRAMMRVEEEAAAREHLRRLDGTPFPDGELPLERSLRRGEEVRGVQLLLPGPGDQDDLPALLNSAPLRDAAEAIDGAVVVFQDITTIKNFEQARDALLATVAHDLKNPLTAIQGLADLTQQQAQRRGTPSDERIVTRQESIVTAATQMTALLNELLDAMQLEMGQPLTLTPHPTDLVALVHRVVDHQQEIADHPLQVEAAPPMLVLTLDEDRIERVVGNLVTNAVKYSPPGAPVRVTIARARDDDGTWALLTIVDRGRGIPAADLPHIFERFYRASNVGQMQGSGIGLASVREIVVQHGGTVRVESTDGVGTRVTVTLPMTQEQE